MIEEGEIIFRVAIGDWQDPELSIIRNFVVQAAPYTLLLRKKERKRKTLNSVILSLYNFEKVRMTMNIWNWFLFRFQQFTGDDTPTVIYSFQNQKYCIHSIWSNSRRFHFSSMLCWLDIHLDSLCSQLKLAWCLPISSQFQSLFD